MRAGPAVVTLVGFAASLFPAPASALPPSPPEIEIAISPTEPVTGQQVTVTAFARDPDGVLTSVQVCIEGAACETAASVHDPAQGLPACVSGDEEVVSVEHVFTTPGAYRITAAATGGVCPGVLDQFEETKTGAELIVRDPPPPPVIDIPCRRGGREPSSPGVSPTSIQIGAGVASNPTGIGASFLRGAAAAIRATVDAINAGGGVCERVLDLTMVDDSWDPQIGYQYIQSFIAQGKFALLNASSEGLGAAIDAGAIDQAQIPVVSDGMLAGQMSDPWVWPVGPATATQGHIVVKDAYDRGARTFGIVYANSHRHGIETAAAFEDAVSRLGGTLSASIGVSEARTSYANEIAQFNASCDPCDAVLLAVTPLTALTWLSGGPRRPAQILAGTAPLMSEMFAANCGSMCNGMQLWTGYIPPVGAAAADPRVAFYHSLVRGLDATIDTANAYTEGAYAQTLLLAQAMGRVGRNLTRAKLQRELDRTQFDAGISMPLTWTEASHNANRWSRMLEIVVSGGSFVGFRAGGGWVEDPWPL